MVEVAKKCQYSKSTGGMCTHVSVTASTLSAVRMENCSFHWGLASEMTLVLARLLSPVARQKVFHWVAGTAPVIPGMERREVHQE